MNFTPTIYGILAISLLSFASLSGAEKKMSKAARARAGQTVSRSERDLLAPAYQVVVLPSSQSRGNIAARVENIFDGDMKTLYESAPGTFPNWIEFRWPQTATADGFQVTIRGDANQPEYIAVCVPDRDKEGEWREIKRVSSQEGFKQHHSFDQTEAPAFRLYFGAAPSGVTSLREVQITGSAPRYELKNPDWHGEYIWFPEGEVSDVSRYFQRDFTVDDPEGITQAVMQISADDAYFLYCNGQFIGTGAISPGVYDLKPYLKAGQNRLTIKAQEFSGDQGLLYELTLVDQSGKTQSVVSDSATSSAKTGFDDPDKKASVASGRSKSGIPFHYIVPSDGPLKISKITGERTVKTGEKLKLAFEMKTAVKLEDDYGFRITIGDLPKGQSADYRVASLELIPPIPTSDWKPGETYLLEGDFYIPDWAPDGMMPLSVEAISTQSVLLPALPEAFRSVDLVKFASRKPQRSQPVHAEVKNLDGSPKLILNGVPLCPFIMTDSAEQDSLHISGRQVRSEAPISRVFLRESDFFAPEAGDREEQFKKIFAIIDQRIDFALRQNQDAYIIFGLAVFPRPEWSNLFPEENTVLPNGVHIRHSFSSQSFLKLGADGVRRITEYLMKSPYAGHIIGIQLGIGEGPETYYWGSNANKPGTPREKLVVGDFSPAAVTAFREFLKQRYQGDVAKLRDAWKDDKIDFATATPDVNELRRKDFDSFRDPAKGKMAMDFWEFQADAVAHTAKLFAKTIKEASKGNWICGLWGFYNVGMNHCTGSIGKGHHIAYNAVELALDDPNIDYLAAIQCYSAVNQGTPVISLFTIDSLRRRGKLFLEEYDIRTFFTDLTFAEGHLYSAKENENIIRRDFGKSIAHDYACWWVGFPVGTKGRMSQGWFAEDSLLKTLRYCQKVRELTYQYPFHSAAEVGLFFEDRDIVTLDLYNGSPLLVNPQYHSIWGQLSAMGVPFELNSFSDFSSETIKPYKVLMFMNIYYLSPEQRQKIELLAKKDNKVVLWLYAPGLVDREKGVDPALVSQLTGIKLEMDAAGRNEKNLKVQLTGKDPLVSSGNGHVFAPDAYSHDPRQVEMGPIFSVNDPDAVILGKYLFDNKNAVAVRRFGDWTSIYCGLPLVTEPLLDGIFREAKVHRYTEKPAFIEVGNRFLSIHPRGDGYSGRISLPAASWVLDVYERKIVARDQRDFTIDLPGFETRLYFFGNRAEVEKLQQQLISYIKQPSIKE